MLPKNHLRLLHIKNRVENPPKSFEDWARLKVSSYMPDVLFLFEYIENLQESVNLFIDEVDNGFNDPKLKIVSWSEEHVKKYRDLFEATLNYKSDYSDDRKKS